MRKLIDTAKGREAIGEMAVRVLDKRVRARIKLENAGLLAIDGSGDQLLEGFMADVTYLALAVKGFTPSRDNLLAL